MEFIRELTDTDIGEEGLSTSGDVRYRLRRASRAVVFNKIGKIALLFVSGKGYHKLPGGGLEPGEDLLAALNREVKEEVGVEIEVSGELGVIIEWRDKHRFMQISYCYIGAVVGKAERPDFTQEEQDEGFMLQWVELDEAIGLMEVDGPEDYIDKFILTRDLLFLKKMKEKMPNGREDSVR